MLLIGWWKKARVRLTANEPVLDEVGGNGLLPIDRGVSGAVEAQLQLPHHAFAIRVPVLYGELDPDVPGNFRVEVRPLDVVHHDLLVAPLPGVRGGLAHYQPKRLQRGRSSKETRVHSDVELFADQARAIIRIRSVSFIRINSTGLDCFASLFAE